MEEEQEYRPLLSYSKDELVELFKETGIPAYRVGQIRRWLFSRKTVRFSQMSDLSKELRARLTRRFAKPESDVPESKPLLIHNDSRTEAEPDEMDAPDSAIEGRLVALSNGATDGALNACCFATTAIIEPHALAFRWGARWGAPFARAGWAGLCVT